MRFTVLGIQKAIRDVVESMLEQERLSTGGTSFFVSARTDLCCCLGVADKLVLKWLSVPPSHFSHLIGTFPVVLLKITESSPHWRSLFVYAEGRRYSRR